MSKPRLRFAPSPTGYLHIGGVRTALFNWLWARKTGGTFVLRIEDTDRERSTDASTKVILDSMNWLGLNWDEGPHPTQIHGPETGNYGPYTQMKRLDIYKEYADRLIKDRKAFRCYCTKELLDEQRAALKAKDPKAQFKYPGTCRNRTDEPNLPYVVRFMTDRSGSITYVDKVFGEVTTPNIEQQDFVLIRSDGVPLYNFGVVVDDITMEISLVARGRDHMINTPPQIMIYQALDAKVPEFAHLPMMLAPSGEKLSKRFGAVAVSEYETQGFPPDAVLNYLARFGWSHGDQEIFSKEELVQAFDWEHTGRGDGKFDPKKFLTISHEHLKSPKLMPEDEYAKRALPFVHARGLDKVTEADVKCALYTIRDRAQTFVQAADMLDPFFREPPELDEKAAAKFLVKDAAPRLRGLADALGKVTDWNEAELEKATHDWVAASGLEMKAIGQPVRVALTGRTASPGLYQVMFVIGRDVTLARLARAAEKADKT
ncbi:Glutamyl-tRNA synthetase [Labilithrix luteola]|uniref:Glutamate--tRNA ligase n=1 Tax=Labilithrix luteola TaxID=1391654 RepID=A0A0K1PSJ7_9BACT|nr:glutamate--tRNA ligase [Labilithrix luteola]AKU96099.1 Glutamyl-tRNA synthetase [Labilithrix luteola]